MPIEDSTSNAQHASLISFVLVFVDLFELYQRHLKQIMTLLSVGEKLYSTDVIEPLYSSWMPRTSVIVYLSLLRF